MLTAFPTALSGIKMAENVEQAATVAQSVLEQYQYYRYNFAAMPSVTDPVRVTCTGFRNGIPYSQFYDYTVQVTPVDTKLNDILVTVNWSENSRPKILRMETLIYDLVHRGYD